jgi:hypothetical protein
MEVRMTNDSLNEVTDAELQRFGYASGAYLSKCLSCGGDIFGCDKRCRCCFDCAVKAFHRAKEYGDKSSVLPEPPNPIPQDLDTYLAEIEVENDNGDVSHKDIARMVAIIRNMKHPTPDSSLESFCDGFAQHMETRKSILGDASTRKDEAVGVTATEGAETCAQSPVASCEISVGAEMLSAVIDEYLHWRKVNPHIKGGENYLKRLRAATRVPVSGGNIGSGDGTSGFDSQPANVREKMAEAGSIPALPIKAEQPVGFTGSGTLEALGRGTDGYIFPYTNGLHSIPLYLAPPVRESVEGAIAFMQTKKSKGTDRDAELLNLGITYAIGAFREYMAKTDIEGGTS